MRGRRVNDDRVVERPEVKFDYNFVKYSSCVKMTLGIGRSVVHIIFGGTVMSTRFSSEVRI